ncbi:hypothetical protein D3C78_549160 [compost metagenome]
MSATPLVQVTTSFANSIAPGSMDNRERWVAARITASHINTFLVLMSRCPKEAFSGEEFESARHLMITFQSACGVLIDGLQTATTLEQLMAINQEYYSMCCAKS